MSQAPDGARSPAPPSLPGGSSPAGRLPAWLRLLRWPVVIFWVAVVMAATGVWQNRLRFALPRAWRGSVAGSDPRQGDIFSVVVPVWARPYGTPCASMSTPASLN